MFIFVFSMLLHLVANTVLLMLVCACEYEPSFKCVSFFSFFLLRNVNIAILLSCVSWNVLASSTLAAQTCNSFVPLRYMGMRTSQTFIASFFAVVCCCK